jgi:hypothetical protein
MKKYSQSCTPFGLGGESVGPFTFLDAVVGVGAHLGKLGRGARPLAVVDRGEFPQRQEDGHAVGVAVISPEVDDGLLVPRRPP